MQNASYRGLPLAALIGMTGAFLGAVLLALPWYSIDPAGVAWVRDGMPIGVAPGEALDGPPDVFLQLIIDGAEPRQKGWRVEPTSWSLFREVAAALAVFAGVKMIRDRAAGSLQRITFLIAAVVFAASPYPYLFMTKGPKFEAVHNVALAPYLSLLAAALMVVALVLADRFRGQDAASSAPVEPLSPASAHPSEREKRASAAPPGFEVAAERGPSRP